MPEENRRCILVCAGDMRLSEIPVKERDFVIAVDGGFSYCEVFGISPDLILGDFDSVGEDQRERIMDVHRSCPGKVIRLSPVKDDTDTLAALREGISRGYREFHLYGALGGRLEHTLANIQCLLFLKNNGAKGYIWDGNAMLTVIREESISFRREMEGMLSIFALGDSAEGVTETGLKYSLDKATVTNDYPVGVSNEFTGQEAEVSVEKGALLVSVLWP